MSEPEIDPQLKELLNRLRSAPERSPDAMSQSRAQFLADLDTFFPAGVDEPVATEGRAVTRPSVYRLVFTRAAFVFALLVCLFAGALTTVRAAQAALPGDALYPIKLNLEKAQVAMATDPARQSELYLGFAQNRLDEIENLAGIGRYADIPDLASAFARHMRMATMTRDIVADFEPERAAHLDEQIALKLVLLKRTLTAVISAAPTTLQPDLRATLDTAMLASQPGGQGNANENANANVGGNENENINANDNGNENRNANTNSNINTNEGVGANTNENANTNANANENAGNENPPVNQTGLAIDHFSIDAISDPQYAGVPFRITVTARDASNNIITSYTGPISLSDTTGTLAPATTGTFSGGRWTGSVKIGQATSNITISAADEAYRGVSNTFNTLVMRPCPCNIWDNATAPPGLSETGGRAIEAGVKFRSDVDGYVTGVRFYKSSQNSGPHTGHLWSSDGTLLATANFTTETTGWQEALFDMPVQIMANTTYIASYFTPGGPYFETSGYFTTATDNRPLHALATGTDGPNGVYRYDTSGFPDQAPADHASNYASNYWVDVVFKTDLSPDRTPPAVISTIPSNNADEVSAGINIQIVFNEAIDPATVTPATFELRDTSNTLIPATISYNTGSHTASLDPAAALAYSTDYTVTIKGGDNGVRDLAGNLLAENIPFSFTTEAPPPPPPDEGPGGPILVVASMANPSGRYYAEILRNEGFNEFTLTDISRVTPTVLEGYDVVILGEMPLTSGQVAWLSDWVSAGGHLIAMRPDAQLADLLGISPAGGTLADAYLLVNTASGPGAGIVDQTIQYHGLADLYQLAGATEVARLYSNATSPSVNPAVTWRSVGSNGGQAAAFTYDLARSVVYTRQGNPAWAGDERDGSGPIRSNDLFFGAKNGDVQPDWIDLSKVAIPQADEQQRLLANLIISMNSDLKPLPRFWYFPRGEKAVVVMTGDSATGGNAGGTAGANTGRRFDGYIARSAPGCSVADWECVRSSAYIVEDNALTDTQVAAYTAAGFEVALQVDTGCNNWTRASLDSAYTTQFEALQALYPSMPLPLTERNRCGVWSDWASQPKVELAQGARLDTNYAYWPAEWVQDRPGMFTGSGMPMRFADLDGSIIDVYQAVTLLTDESGQSYPATIDTLLGNALGPLGYYGAFVANMQSDSPSSGSEAIIASAKMRGVPVISARQLLEWLDGRNGSRFTNLVWNGNTLTFNVEVGAGARGLQAMLPKQSADGTLKTITSGGSPVTFTTQTIKGVEYAIFDASPGDYIAKYVADAAAPIITNVTALPHPDGTATILWTTNENADTKVVFGTTPQGLNTPVTNDVLVTDHSLVLSGLDPNTTYYYRVTSTDLAENSATFPRNGDTLSFTTPSATLVDTTVADFNARTLAACTIANLGDGAIILDPAMGTEFDSASLPANWSTHLWTGGEPVVSDGVLTVNGAYARDDTLYGPGRSLTFVATFGAQPSQQVGFGGADPTFSESPWIVFSTGEDGAQLYARIHTPGDPSNTGDDRIELGSQYLGSPHRYRIDWQAGRIDFSIDGVMVAGREVIVATPMRVAASVYNASEPSLTVDWLRLSPYNSPCSFQSRIFDAGSPVAWSTIAWTGSTPAGTSLVISVRTGNTPTPDGSWTTFSPVANGASIGGTSRYIQYRAALATTDSSRTPILSDVTLGFSMGSDTTPPVIIDRSPLPGAIDVDVTSNITVQFNEPMDATSLTETTFRLQADGGSGDIPATISYDLPTKTATLDPASDLAFDTRYIVTVEGSVSDSAGNSLGAGDTWSFTTVLPSSVSTTNADFDAGASTCTVDNTLGDGALRLGATLDEAFSGSSLPSGWSASSSSEGTPVISGGLLTVDGVIAGATTTYGPGRTLRFVATFGPEQLQHAGFAESLSLDSAWAIFSTKDNTASLYARTSANGDTLIPGSYIGTPHRYRIDWSETEVRFYIDGTLVATHSVALTAPMLPMVSDFELNGSGLAVDWMTLTPYFSSCAYESDVIDAGALADWLGLTWTGSTPAGTAVSVAVRTGDTSAPDSSWTDWQTVDGATILNSNGRYLQYRFTLTSSDGSLTPVVESVTVDYDLLSDQTPVAPD